MKEVNYNNINTSSAARDKSKRETSISQHDQMRREMKAATKHIKESFKDKI